MHRSWIRRSLALGAAGALVLGVAPTAGAHPPRPPRPPEPVLLAENLAGPLSFDVTRKGTLYVGQAFSGVLTRIDHKGRTEDIVKDLIPGTDVAAVSVDGGTITWAETFFPAPPPGEGEPPAEEPPAEEQTAVLKQLTRRGWEREIDLFAYEKEENPDGDVQYGFVGLGDECAATLPPFLQPYDGIVESHPYGSVTVGKNVYVADAGSNAILKVNKRGRVSTVAVLPPTEIEVTAEIAAAQELDPCVVGTTFLLEPVPTDVEVGKHGLLYVSTLPGGPEDGSLGDNGAVYTVNPWNGRVRLVADGFAGATGLAVAPDGTVYVAELFGNEISAISKRGKVTTVASLPMPAAVEWAKGRLYVSHDIFAENGGGKISTLRVR